MSVSTATSYDHEDQVMQATSAESSSVSTAFPRPVLLHFDASIAASRLQQANMRACLRGLCNGLILELAAAAVIFGIWWLVHIS